ncbi:putative oxidase [Podospora fimiseda]|uniref:Oxidase n=1 Tax=Podospora fimiseda TaxID=252190 RepID=A0AAN7GYE2_9PEZI|nr:putative oxidase [Podospora fimiseda]
MGQSPSALQTCIDLVGNGRAGFAGYPHTAFYQTNWVKRYNLAIPVTPIAVVRPDNAQDIADVVKCAALGGFKVQAKSGGHSYGNYGLGGQDGAVSIDLVNMKKFVMDNTTWQATIGAGTLLGEVDKKLHAAGGRAFAHGVCPGVGIGGHCTIGGLGPMSRMWGSCLDHIVDMEVVTAEGKIVRTNKDLNQDLFFALRGAASGFGIITEFVMRTHPEPNNIVSYEYNVRFGKQADGAEMFSKWQALMADPKLDRRFGSMFTMFPFGAVISGTFYGTEEEFDKSVVRDYLPKEKGSIILDDYLGHMAHLAEKEALYVSNLAAPFYAKSLGFRRDEILGPEEIKKLFSWTDKADKGTLLWAIIFSGSGGIIEDIPQNSTAYAHRDKVIIYESYGIGLPAPRKATRDFLTGFYNQVFSLGKKSIWGTYPGYVDNELAEPQRQYWDSNLGMLEGIKTIRDPLDIFHNPGSVRPLPVR